jgi:hypothetical protein
MPQYLPSGVILGQVVDVVVALFFSGGVSDHVNHTPQQGVRANRFTFGGSVKQGLSNIAKLADIVGMIPSPLPSPPRRFGSLATRVTRRRRRSSAFKRATREILDYSRRDAPSRSTRRQLESEYGWEVFVGAVFFLAARRSGG